jgi:hypothetical protein
MAYPFQPPVENAYQVAGKALMQGGEVLGSMRDMIEKRKLALIAQRRAEIEAQQKADALEMQKQLQEQTIASSKKEMEFKGADEARKALAEENKQKFQKAIFEGRQVPTGNQIPAPMQTAQSMDPNLLNQGQSQELDMIPEMRREDYSKEDLIKLALENDQLTPKDYLEQTRDRTKQLRPTYKQGKDGYIYVWEDDTQSWDRTNLEGMPPQSSMPSYQSITVTNPDGSKKVIMHNPKDPRSAPIDPGINITPPEASVNHVPGLKTIAGTKITPKSVDKVKNVKQTYDNLKKQLREYKNLYSITGAEAVGSDAEALESMERGMQLSLKELENLGALTGPDVGFMRKMVPGAGGVGAKGRALLNPVLGNKFYRQMDVLNKRLDNIYSSTIKSNGFEVDNGAKSKPIQQPNRQVTEQDIDNMTAEEFAEWERNNP